MLIRTKTNPLSYSPVACWSNRRLPGMLPAKNLCEVRRIVAADTVMVSDISDTQYKTGGAWTDPTGETLAVKTLYDISQNSNNAAQATEANQPVLKFSGGVYNFDGVNSFFYTVANATLDVDTGFLLIKFATTTPGGSFRGLITKQYAYSLFLSSSILGYYNWSAAQWVSSGINVADSAIHVAALDFQAGTARIFLDAALVKTGNFAIDRQTDILRIGENASQKINAKIYFCMLFNKNLSQSQITKLNRYLA